MAVNKSVGERLRKIRELHGLSLDAAAEKSGVCRSNITFAETARYPVSSDVLIKLCKFYGVSSDYILGLADMPTSQYKADIRELYQKSYEQYLVAKKSPDYVTEYYIKGKKPIADWPYNLLEACEFDMDFPISDSQYEGLKEVIDHKLPIREAVIVCAYYMKHMTLNEIANEFDVTTERIRQILMNGVRRIKHPARANIILHGANYIAVNKELAEVNAKLAEIAEKKKIIESCGEEFDKRYSDVVAKLKEDPLNTTLDELELSVRSYNCIRRYFWHSDVRAITVKDIVPLFQSGEIVKVRNLGRKSCEEIRNRLIEIGIPAEELTPIGGLFNVGA